MPRRTRLFLPGIPWHIIQCGNNRAVCFHGEQDYQLYLHYLKEFADKFGCAGLLMKHLSQRYVQYINRTYQRSGTLWEGRFRS